MNPSGVPTENLVVTTAQGLTRDWSRLASPKVITLDVASMSEDELRRELLDLRERHARLLAILRLVVVLLKVCTVSLRDRRVPDGEKKRLLLRAVDSSRDVLSRRVLAQTEIACSNSLIESWWRSLKHQWLFLNQLDSVGSLHRLAEFYVGGHNTRLPHSAFRGQTPDEMYFATGHGVPNDLETKRTAARETRMAANRARSYRVCRESVST